MYTQAPDPAIRNPFSAQRFARDGQTYTLIADRVGSPGLGGRRGLQRGVAVRRHRRHQQGLPPSRQSSGGSVLRPLLAGGRRDRAHRRQSTTGYRVIEVRYGDYSGRRAGQRVHSGQHRLVLRGSRACSGNGPGQLAKPHSAQRLANGNVLICDAGDDVYGARVIEVDRATGSIVWQYGVTGPPGTGDDYLHEANFAVAPARRRHAHRRHGGAPRAAGDEGQDHRARVGPERLATPPGYETGESAPRAAAYHERRPAGGRRHVFQQIVPLGYESSAQATSLPLDCGHPGVDKAFVSLTWKRRHRRSRDEDRPGVPARTAGRGGRARSRAGFAGTTSKPARTARRSPTA